MGFLVLVLIPAVLCVVLFGVGKFLRKPEVNSLKVTGTITSKDANPVTDEQASVILDKLVDSIDGTIFEVETLTVVVK